ncbi:hypothetical protein [Streptomyces sp. 3N207]|uniref:hypothetical protein n=1 Tax=Streptomyces sp. 3N207 TaxID=3457417 RepID=UPI003FD2F250
MADTAVAVLALVRFPASTTAAGQARRFDTGQQRGIEAGIAAVNRRVLSRVPPDAAHGCTRE